MTPKSVISLRSFTCIQSYGLLIFLYLLCHPPTPVPSILYFSQYCIDQPIKAEPTVRWGLVINTVMNRAISRQMKPSVSLRCLSIHHLLPAAYRNLIPRRAGLIRVCVCGSASFNLESRERNGVGEVWLIIYHYLDGNNGLHTQQFSGK